jgi:hypothetical protein
VVVPGKEHEHMAEEKPQQTSQTFTAEKEMPLRRELATYRRELPRLLEEGEAGHYALIKGDELISVWDTYRDAIQYGQELFGPNQFMAQKIDPRDVERVKRFFPEEKPSCLY